VFGLEAAEPVGAHVVRRTVVRIREEADVRALENPDGGGGRRDGGEERDGGDCRLGHDELAKKMLNFENLFYKRKIWLQPGACTIKIFTAVI